MNIAEIWRFPRGAVVETMASNTSSTALFSVDDRVIIPL